MPKAILAVNIVLLVVFAAALLGLGRFGSQEAEQRFTDLDRAGVVNADALERFAPSYGFGEPGSLQYRAGVPAWLNAPTLGALRAVGVLGALAAAVNVALGAAWLARGRGRGR